MEHKKAKNAILRYKGRKYPIISVIFEDNKERAITVRADLKTAEKLHIRIKKEIALGTFKIRNYTPKRMKHGLTLREFSKNYLEYRSKLVQIDQISIATFQHDKYAMQLLLDRLDSALSIKSLTNDDMINFLMLLKDAPNKKKKTYQPGAINSYLKQLKTAFNWAVKEKLIDESPLKDVSLLHNPKEGMYRFISEEDIDKIRKYLQGKPEWQLDIFNLCLWTGARRMEVFNLKKQDLYVEQIKGESVPFARLLGKGKKFRNMPLCQEACELLDRRVKYLTNTAKQYEIMSRSFSPTQHKPLVESRLKQGYLFWEIINCEAITRAYSRVRNKLGLDYFNTHSLRHSFATYCLKDDVPVTTVKEFLGHSNIRTTMIYAKTDDEIKARDIKKLKPR